MKIKKSQFYSILLFILVLLPIYKDSPLALYLGAAGYTIVMPLSLILFTLYFLMRKYKSDNEYVTRLFKLVNWLFITSIMGLIVWLLFGNPINYIGEYLPFKSLKVILQYLSFPCYMYLLILCLRNVKEEKLLKYCFWIMIFMIFINIIELLQKPYALEVLHFSAVFPYNRIRLLTLEASETTSLIFVYCGLSLYYALKHNNKLHLFITSLCILFFIKFSSAKSLFLLIGIFLILYIILDFNKIRKNKLWMFILFIFTTLFIIFIFPRFYNEIFKDIAMFTSTATRTYTIVVGFIIGLIFPFGVGCAAHLGVLKYFLQKFIFIFNMLPIKFNISEIVTIMNSNTDYMLTVKSGLMQYNLYWGILGSIYFLSLFVKMSSELRKISNDKYLILLSIYWLCILMMILLNMNFEYFIVFALVASIIEKESGKSGKEKSRNNNSQL